jgi:hypothetical protein
VAISYANVFAILGKYVKLANTVTALYSGLATQESAAIALSAYSGTDYQDQLDNVSPTFDSVRAGLLGSVSDIPGRMQEILLDREGILTQLNLGDESDFDTVMDRFLTTMLAATEYIEDSTVTVGSVTRTVTNANAGYLYVSKVLDAYNSPLEGASAHRSYFGVNSELACTETITVRCITDDDTVTGTGGSESWQVYGYPTSNDESFGWLSEGSGTGPILTTTAASAGLLSNGDFESFTSNAPGSWTIVTGSAGTHILATSANEYLGTYGLELVGNASLAAVTISQVVSVDPGRMYSLAAWVKGNASLTQGTLTIGFTGTGYSAGATEQIAMTQANLAAATSYTHKHAFVLIPRNIPSDFKLVITFAGTPSAHSIYVDEVVLTPVTYHGGVAIGGPFQGSSKFVKEDTHVFTLSNNDAGVFQKFFRRVFKKQFPSNASATRADSLAT